MSEHKIRPETMSVEVVGNEKKGIKRIRMVFGEGKDTYIVRPDPGKVGFVRQVMEDIERQMRAHEVQDGYRIED